MDIHRYKTEWNLLFPVIKSDQVKSRLIHKPGPVITVKIRILRSQIYDENSKNAEIAGNKHVIELFSYDNSEQKNQIKRKKAGLHSS